jgi:chromosome segregation ATPase
MAKTNAEHQREHRQRQAAEVAALRLALGDARSALADAESVIATLGDKLARREREIEGLYATLAETSAAPRDTGPQTPDCPHPAHLVDGDRCLGCGQLVDSWS